MAKKILICEDNTPTAKAVARSVELLGYSAVTLAKKDSSSCVLADIEEVVEKEQPDYVFLDGLSGRDYEAADLVKAVKPDARIVIVSADSEIIKDAASQGYAALTKPISRARLSELLKKLEA